MIGNVPAILAVVLGGVVAHLGARLALCCGNQFCKALQHSKVRPVPHRRQSVTSEQFSKPCFARHKNQVFSFHALLQKAL